MESIKNLKIIDIEKIKNTLNDNELLKLFIKTFLITIFFSIIAYNLLMIYSYTNPDGIMEGLYYYDNTAWASANGRWFTRYLSQFFGGIVNPTLDVFFYSLCISLSVILIKRMCPKMTNLSVYLSSIILIVNPVVIFHFQFLYMSICYGLAFLMATLFVYANYKWRYFGFIIAIFSLSISIGLYQSYIGVAAALALITIIYRFITNEESLLSTVILTVKYIISGILGCLLYLKFIDLDTAKHSIDAAARVKDFSFDKIIANLASSISYAYNNYFSFYKDAILNRDKYFLVLLVVFVVALVLVSFILIKNRKYLSFVLVLVLTLLVPLCSNIIKIAYPDYSINLVMSHQMLLFVVFVLILIDTLNKTRIYLKTVSAISIVMLIWTYLLSANATFRCYQMSYRYLNQQYSMIVDDIFHTEGYRINECPILVAGFVDDSFVRESSPLYKYAVGLPNNLAFWEDENGILTNRYNYFLNYFGINPLYFNMDDYNYYVNCEEFKAMPVWPQEGSVQNFNGTIIVKLTDNPIGKQN